jgi:two-component system, cell cycle sensor histidine kinase and response regulator CckA
MDIPMSAHPDAFDPEQEKIREALWRSEAQLALAVEVAGGVGTWDWDLKTDLIYCNKRFADLFSVDPAVAATEGVRSADYIAAIHPEDQHIVVENTQHAIATMGPYVVEFRLPQKNGSEIWIYALGHAYSDAEGNPSRFPGAAMDITQRKQMEAELKIARDQAQTILESITDGFFALDQNFCFSYMNQAGEQILGARREDLLGKCLWEFYPEVYGTQVQEEYERAIRDQKSTTFEWFFEAWQRWFAIKAYPTHEGGLSIYFRDISDQKKAEEQERLRQEQVRESARLESLGVMAGGIAHDFNNLLTAIMGNASLLVEYLSGSVQAMAEQIVIASERAADLTKQMLAFSGKGSFVVEPMDLNTLVQENFMLLRASLSRSINIELRLSDEPCLIEADRGQMQQIVMNVLINASEAIGDNPGKIEIRTALIERTGSEPSILLRGVVPPGRYAFFEVRDNGSGMSPETVKRIFDPFFTTKFTGRGLGLAAVLGIVRGHRGDIEVETQLGAGATFRVLLPASERTVPVSKEPEPRRVARGTGQKILVVDDEEIVRTIAVTALKNAGFSVLVATNGAEALAILTANSEVALVILDLTMPVMTGERAIPLIKLSRPNIPIILSSGYSEAELSRRFSSAGISAFLQKPYTASAILAKVTQILEVLTP